MQVWKMKKVFTLFEKGPLKLKIIWPNYSADLVAFGRGFLANPDFVSRIEKNVPLNEVDFNSLYSSGEVSYTDYQLYNSK